MFKIGVLSQYYPDKKEIIRKIKKQPLVIQEYELSKLSINLRATNDHKFYEFLISSFVPSWDKNIHGKKIFGGGGGSGSLNSFRKVEIEGKYYFEKIYFTNQKEFKTIQWYQEYVQNELIEIVIPKVCKIFEGRVISAVYFEFLELKPLKPREMESKVVEMASLLYHSSTRDVFQFSDIEPFIKDFRESNSYQSRFRNTVKRVPLDTIEWTKLEKAAADSRIILAHGDLQEYNVFNDEKLIDWDFSSLRPIGFDASFAYFSLIIRNRVKKFSFSWIETSFKSMVDKKEWFEFERNFYFFLYLFFIWRFNEGRHLEIEKLLIEKLKGYL